MRDRRVRSSWNKSEGVSDLLCTPPGLPMACRLCPGPHWKVLQDLLPQIHQLWVSPFPPWPPLGRLPFLSIFACCCHSTLFIIFFNSREFPGGVPSGWDSVLSLPWAQVRSLVRDLRCKSHNVVIKFFLNFIYLFLFYFSLFFSLTYYFSPSFHCSSLCLELPPWFSLNFRSQHWHYGFPCLAYSRCSINAAGVNEWMSK